MERCNGGHEAVAWRKEHSRRSDYFYTPEVIGNFQEKVMDDPGKRMRALPLEMDVTISTMSLDLNEDIR